MVTVSATNVVPPKGLRNNILTFFMSILGSNARSSKIIAALGISLVLTVYAVDRWVSYRINTQEFVKAPCNYIDRVCPAPSYVTNPEAYANQKICITTLTDSAKGDLLQRLVRWRNFDALLEMTWPNKQKYATKHGYHLFDESKSLDTSRPPSWSKIKAVRRLLMEEHCDWVFWLDADTVIMNSERRVQDFLPPEGIDLLVTEEKLGKYNAGAWIIRNTPWALEFLDRWWNMNSFVKAKGLAVSGDNDALCSLLLGLDKKYFDAHIAVPPRCTFNSVAIWVTPEESHAFANGQLDIKEQEWYMNPWKYHRGDFIAHVAGKQIYFWLLCRSFL